METGIGLSEIGAAILGAIAAGLWQLISSHFERKRRSEAVLSAIASEVDAICRLIQHQGYYETLSSIARDIENGKWDGTTYVIDIRSNYFCVFEGLVGELGHLEPWQSQKIVNFYSYCKSIIDSTRTDNPHGAGQPTDNTAANILSLTLIMRSTLTLGSEIVLMPKRKFVSELDLAPTPEPSLG